MEFVHDTLFDGSVVRVQTVVDDFRREAPTLEVGRSMPRSRVARALDRSAETRGLPQVIVVDNGPESTS